ncbi:MAG: phosphoribosylglycinamide formyltransferase [Sphingobacteriales bacterium]|uniref:phosphoribosylglycinamide formyltransferase n=1 Tax=Hydrotalea flava TaxID=714549 RepID=UPI000831A3C3|nr:phosphoribosylglycinamide formyltransferase [Hydrotalea flava]RTL47641.1 MAG: phosphoribosylglycinamide formyltransferase [Sphingobacteriales bacterium]
MTLSYPQQKLAIFASGTGSNTANLIHYFQQHPFITIQLIVTNNPNAGVIQIARQHQIPVLLIEKERFQKTDGYVSEIQAYGIHWIILAGFLWKVPLRLIEAFPHRIINIHPALLPKYGGKGMYGIKVHQAIAEAGESVTGITIHFVNEHYDDGPPIFQTTCSVAPTDTPEQIAQKVHALEYAHFPKVIEDTILQHLKTKST